MFRAPPHPSSGAYNYINSLWFYLRSVVVAALFVRVYDHDKQHCYHHTPKIKPEAVNPVLSYF
jgi:hypothetical protein